MTVADANDAGTRLTVRVPLQIRRRGGRKVVVVPQGPILEARRPDADTALIKAIARAYRWQLMLEEGTYTTMRELAAEENISASYISRLLQLTLTAPSVVEAMLDGEQNHCPGGAHEPSRNWCEQVPTHGLALERP